MRGTPHCREKDFVSLGIKGQNIVEYTLLFGIIIAAIVAMSPMIKRTSQAMVKLVADQVGEQKNAEQIGGDTGWLKSSVTATEVSKRERLQEAGGNIIKTTLEDRTLTGVTSASDLGFTERD